MDKIQFNNLTILEQIKYINNTLAKGESLRGISANLGMSKTTIRDRFLKFGYVFNSEARQYIKDNSINLPGEVEYKSNTNIFNDADAKNKMMDILSKYDNLVKMAEVSTDLIEMMEWYNKQKNIVEPVELKIDSSKFIGEVKTTTVRLYSDVWINFREFTEGYKEFKSQDLLSQALIEFMQKYKK